MGRLPNARRVDLLLLRAAAEDEAEDDLAERLPAADFLVVGFLVVAAAVVDFFLPLLAAVARVALAIVVRMLLC